MKHIFEETDIVSGMWVSRNDVLSVLGWRLKESELHGRVGDGARQYYLTEINTDGMIYDLGTTKEVVEFLTTNEYLKVNKKDFINS